jgi:4,5:9,10-diseco-3-hydroxy-5,9,17-trioxoandrosta-1(10),2-diene-4-oate hydrolase
VDAVGDRTVLETSVQPSRRPTGHVPDEPDTSAEDQMNQKAVALDVQERWVEVAGMKIHVTETGAGEPLVMLHGGGPGASGMSNFRTNLANLGARFRLIIIDQPGFGGSSKTFPEGQSYWKSSALAVKEVLAAAGIEKAHLVGNSLGGGTALRFALDYPEATDRLVLMGPGGGSVNIFTPGDIARGVDKAVRRFYESPTPERMREFVDFMVFDPSTASDELVEERLQAATDPESMAFMLTLFMALANDPEAELWKRVDEIQKRTLLIWGREDRVLPFDSSLLMFHRMKDVRLVAFSECGHWVQSEKQQEFDRLVIDFLTAD